MEKTYKIDEYTNLKVTADEDGIILDVTDDEDNVVKSSFMLVEDLLKRCH